MNDICGWVKNGGKCILEKENQQLKDKINKVAEYINDLSLDFYDYECEQLIVGKYVINDLLNLLKEDNKEEN